MLEQIQSGQVPPSIKAHEDVLRHYNVSSVYLAREVADRIAAGKLTWAQYGGTHPKPAGNAVAAGLIGELLESPLGQAAAGERGQGRGAAPGQAARRGQFF